MSSDFLQRKIYKSIISFKTICNSKAYYCHWKKCVCNKTLSVKKKKKKFCHMPLCPGAYFY